VDWNAYMWPGLRKEEMVMGKKSWALENNGPLTDQGIHTCLKRREVNYLIIFLHLDDI
jgi:hypothetical protein